MILAYLTVNPPISVTTFGWTGGEWKYLGRVELRDVFKKKQQTDILTKKGT